MAFTYSRASSFSLLGAVDTGTVTSSATLDTAFVFETSGDAFCARFVAPVSQSSATLTFYAFITAVTGSPTFQIEVREGFDGSGDVDRPRTAGSNIGTSSSTVSAPSVNTWCTWTITCSLTRGDTYWVLIKNTHGTPASNHATFQIRGALDSGSAPGATVAYLGIAGSTIDGFATDPVINTNGPGTWVIKFGDGSLLGFPFVTSTAHTSNANNRGNRFVFNTDVTISGIVTQILSALLSGVAIAQGGTVLVSETGDASTANAAGKGVFRFAPTTLTGGVAYDIYFTFSGSATSGPFYGMGQAEGSVPTDVKACMPGYFVGAIDSATTTFTPDTSTIQLMLLILDDFPAPPTGAEIAEAVWTRGERTLT